MKIASLLAYQPLLPRALPGKRPCLRRNVVNQHRPDEAHIELHSLAENKLTAIDASSSSTSIVKAVKRHTISNEDWKLV
jgi:hypothetical protein